MPPDEDRRRALLHALDLLDTLQGQSFALVTFEVDQAEDEVLFARLARGEIDLCRCQER